jgi:hypothetical protein
MVKQVGRRNGERSESPRSCTYSRNSQFFRRGAKRSGHQQVDRAIGDRWAAPAGSITHQLSHGGRATAKGRSCRCRPSKSRHLRCYLEVHRELAPDGSSRYLPHTTGSGFKTNTAAIKNRFGHISLLRVRQQPALSARAIPRRRTLPGAAMPTYPSPFEYLLAFGLVFAAGVLTSVGLRQYTDKIRRESAAHA